MSNFKKTMERIKAAGFGVGTKKATCSKKAATCSK